MQIIIDATSLTKALSTIRSSVSKDRSILSCVKIIVADEDIELIAFNGVFGTTQKVPARVYRDERQGEEFTVGYSILSELVAKLEGDIDLELEDTTLTIQNNNAKFKLSTQEVQEYPNLPVVNSDGCQIDWNTSSNILKSVAAVASDEISKRVLTGVCFNQVDNTTEVAATDSHRLIVRKLNTLLPFESTVVPKELIEAAIVAFKNQADVEIAIEGNLVKFSSDSTQLIGFVLSGNFPHYKQLIPEKFKQTIEVSAMKLSSALKLVSPIASSNRIVSLNFTENTLELNTQSELGFAKAEVNLENPVQEQKISFNLKYLEDSLPNHTGAIRVGLIADNQPVIIGAENYTYLLMPIQVSGAY